MDDIELADTSVSRGGDGYFSRSGVKSRRQAYAGPRRGLDGFLVVLRGADVT